MELSPCEKWTHKSSFFRSIFCHGLKNSNWKILLLFSLRDVDYHHHSSCLIHILSISFISFHPDSIYLCPSHSMPLMCRHSQNTANVFFPYFQQRYSVHVHPFVIVDIEERKVYLYRLFVECMRSFRYVCDCVFELMVPRQRWWILNLYMNIDLAELFCCCLSLSTLYRRNSMAICTYRSIYKCVSIFYLENIEIFARWIQWKAETRAAGSFYYYYGYIQKSNPRALLFRCVFKDK